MADGLELALLDVSENGVVLAPRDAESRFAMGLSDYRRSLARDGHKLERGTIAVLQAGVAAAFFPTAAKLDDPDEAVETVRLSDIREVAVLNLCHQLASLQQGDAEAMSTVLRRAWDQLLALPVHQHDARARVALLVRRCPAAGAQPAARAGSGPVPRGSQRRRLLFPVASLSAAARAPRGRRMLFALCHQLALGKDEGR